MRPLTNEGVDYGREEKGDYQEKPKSESSVSN